MIGLDLGPSALPLRGGGAALLLMDFIVGRFHRGGAVAASVTDLAGVSFGRASAGLAPRVDGTLASAAANVPRITDRGLLLETQRTNVVIQSRSPAASWTARGAATMAASGLVGRDGVTAGTLFSGIGALSTNDAFILCAGSIGASARAEPSFDIRKVSASGVLRVIQAQSGTNGEWRINLAMLGSGWERITRSHPAVTIVTEFSATAAGLVGMLFAAQSGGPLSFHVDLAQLEAGVTSTSPIVTTTATATRAADVVSVLVPVGATSWEAVHGDADTVVTGVATPGSSLDLVTGRPWANGFLKRLTIR